MEPTELSIDERIKATLSNESDTPTQSESEETETTETVEDVVTEEVAEETTEDYEEESETEESETELEEVAESDTPEELPTTYTVKVNGEEKEVSMEDLRKGYMMENDYRQKTAEIAETRKGLTERLSTIDSLIADAEPVLQVELEDLESPDFKLLKEQDPATYYETRDKLSAKADRVAKLREEKTKLLGDVSKEAAAHEAELLKAALPEWLDEDVAKADFSKMDKLWKANNYTSTELASQDHRFILLSRKAALYDELVNAKPESKIINKKPTQAKASATKTTEDKGSPAYRKQLAKLKKSKTEGDALAAIKMTL